MERRVPRSREGDSHGNQTCVEALLRNREIISFQGSHISIYRFLYIRERGFLRLTLAHAAGQARTLGHPEVIFSPIDQHLTRTPIVPDFGDVSDVPTLNLLPGSLNDERKSNPACWFIRMTGVANQRTDPQLFPRSETAFQRSCRGSEQQG
jgi:hypothetical protein